MKKSILYGVLAISLITSASVFANGGRGGGGRGGGGDSMRQRWICRADATDGSGLFFLGMGWSYGEAYSKAQNTCQRARRFCTIDCEAQFPSN